MLWLAVAAGLLFFALAARRTAGKQAVLGWAVVAAGLLGVLLAARFGPRFLALVAPTLGLWCWQWLRARAASRGRPPPFASPARPTPMSREEALRVLGLQEGATAAQVVAAHRSLIKKVHPDQGGSAVLAQQVNEAKRVLESPS